MKIRSFFGAAALCVVATMAHAQQTRSALSAQNNSQIKANGVGAITGTILNGLLGNIINSMGALTDTNSWTGANTFSNSSSVWNGAPIGATYGGMYGAASGSIAVGNGSSALPLFVTLGTGVSAALQNSVNVSGGIASYPVAAGNLSGTSLPSAIVSSSLTSVGTLATGVWNATPIGTTAGGLYGATLNAIPYGGGAGTLPSFVVAGSGVLSALANATNAASGFATQNGAITTGNCTQWGPGVTDSGSVCYDPVVVNVKTDGAVGNSNGTHGNGHDDTSAIQTALTASAGGTMFLPCGTYRITSTLSVTDTSPREIYGHGSCTKIFSDQSSAAATFFFSPSVGTCGSSVNRPCIVVRNLVFLTPNTVSAGQSAITFDNENSTLVADSEFIGQQVGISYTNSFAPKIHRDSFYGGATHIFSSDLSFNSGEIWGSSFYNSTSISVDIAPASGCASGVSIHDNDFEQNSTALGLSGLCSGDISNNYIENAHTQTPFFFSGTTNSGLRFAQNSINGATDTSVGGFTIQDVTNAQFVNNDLLNLSISFGSAASAVRLRATENTLSNTTLPAPSVVCTGYGTGGSCSVLSGDDWAGLVAINTGTSPSASGSITLTFTNPLGSNHSVCGWTPVNDTASWSAPVTNIANSASASSTIDQWTNSTTLTASKIYFMSYICGGM